MTSLPTFETLAEAFAYCRDMDASLAERLDAFNNATRYLLPGYQEAVDRMVARLKSAETGQSAPKPGEIMPEFILPDETGRLVSLKNLLATGPVAVVFHRGHWCPYCRINTRALAEAQDEIVRDGGQIVAIMPDREQFADQLQVRGRRSLPGADGHGQWLCAFAQSGDLGRRGDAIDLGRRKPAIADLPGQRFLGHARSREPSSCARTAPSRPVSSTPTIDGA